MKAFPLFAFLAVFLLTTSCKDSSTSENESNDQPAPKEQPSSITTTHNEKKETKTFQDGVAIEEDKADSTPAKDITKHDAPPAALSGNFIKMGEEMDNSCACYCVNVNYSGNSELCLTPSKIFINVRMAKSNDKITNIYFVNPSSKNTEGKDIPWNKFDKNAPIATITSKENGEITLDWLGFSLNGDLAIDYAILGKKTLEGNYKKK